MKKIILDLEKLRKEYLSGNSVIIFSDLLKDNNIESINEGKECDNLFKIDNGITLCVDCHKKTMNKEKNFEENFKRIIRGD